MIEDDSQAVRKRTVSVEEIKPDMDQDLLDVINILNDPVNAIHFTQAAKTVEDAHKLAMRPDYHLLAARNQLGEIIGTLSVVDESWDVNTHLIEKTAVRSDLHSLGIGRQMFEKAIHWAFETPTYQNRMRKILVLWVEEDLPGWEKMQALVYKLGFIQMMHEPDLIVKVIDGIEVEKPAARYHLRRDRYEDFHRQGKYRTI